MSKPISFPPQTAERMEILLKQAKTASETKRIQCVLLGAKGISSLNIALVVGWIPEYIRSVWQNYRRKGNQSLLGERRGKSRGRAFCSLEEEAEFLAPYFEEAKKGGILIVSEIQKAYEKKIKRKVHHPRIYELLRRHGWRKIAPRPYHPKVDKAAQAEFRRIFPPEDN